MNLREKIEKPVAGVIQAEQKVALFCGKCFLCVQILNYIPDKRVSGWILRGMCL